MIHIELSLPATLDFAQAEPIIDRVCTAAGLRITLKTPLAQYPGCCHWHLKQGKARGTLEITAWPCQRRIWFNVHKNRTGVWIEEWLPRLKSALEQAFVAKK